jgi:hypothetical protein
MTTSTAHHEMEGEDIITLQSLEAAAKAIRQRGDVRKGGIKGRIGAIIRHWDEWLLAQVVDFRTDESVLQERDWRVPYGMDSPEARQLVGEIDRRRKHGLSLVGLEWPPSDDPYAPANDPDHPYYIPKQGES